MATAPALLSRYSQDIGFDTRLQARYVGNLEEGRSKVSVNSSLSTGDRWDHFRLQVTTDQFVRLVTGEVLGKDGEGSEAAETGTVRYQLLSGSGRVVADSDPDSGAEYDAWRKLTSDANLELSRGSYTLRVARGPDAVSAQEYLYAVTFRSGVSAVTGDSEETAFREFLTTERPALPGAEFDQFGSVTAILGLFADVRVF